MMQELDPFSYYSGHGSAIPGFGDEAPPPHPHYCLHTDYISLRSGLTQYVVRLQHVRATAANRPCGSMRSVGARQTRSLW